MARGESPFQGRYTVPQVDFSPIAQAGRDWGRAFEGIGREVGGAIKERKGLKGKLKGYQKSVESLEELLPHLLESEETAEPVKTRMKELRQMLNASSDMNLREKVAAYEQYMPTVNTMLSLGMQKTLMDKRYPTPPTAPSTALYEAGGVGAKPPPGTPPPRPKTAPTAAPTDPTLADVLAGDPATGEPIEEPIAKGPSTPTVPVTNVVTGERIAPAAPAQPAAVTPPAPTIEPRRLQARARLEQFERGIAANPIDPATGRRVQVTQDVVRQMDTLRGIAFAPKTLVEAKAEMDEFRRQHKGRDVNFNFTTDKAGGVSWTAQVGDEKATIKKATVENDDGTVDDMPGLWIKEGSDDFWHYNPETDILEPLGNEKAQAISDRRLALRAGLAALYGRPVMPGEVDGDEGDMPMNYFYKLYFSDMKEVEDGVWTLEIPEETTSGLRRMVKLEVDTNNKKFKNAAELAEKYRLMEDEEINLSNRFSTARPSIPFRPRGGSVPPPQAPPPRAQGVDKQRALDVIKSGGIR